MKKSGLKLLLLLMTLVLVTSCKLELYSHLEENEANDILSVLLRNGIDSDKVAGEKTTFDVRVEKTQVTEALAILKDHGLPKQKYENLGNLFKKEGLISSPLEEQVRFIYGLSQNISETLSQIDGVITARVLIVLPENNPFADVIKPSSASVFIKYRPDSNLGDIKSEIKMIVENSIEGLSYDKVSVVMLPAEPQARMIGQGAGNTIQSNTTFLWLLVTGLLVLLIAIGGFMIWYLRKTQGLPPLQMPVSIIPFRTKKKQNPIPDPLQRGRGG